MILVDHRDLSSRRLGYPSEVGLPSGTYWASKVIYNLDRHSSNSRSAGADRVLPTQILYSNESWG
jgi:hypothetical protein